MRPEARSRGEWRSGFTLLEIMVAVMIIALLVISVYRFVTANLQAIRMSTELAEQNQSVTGLVNFIQSQLNNLPPGNPNVLTGEPFKKAGLRGDRMEWVCRAGEGVLTTAAPDEYRVTLTLEAPSKESNELAIGIRRRLADDEIKNSKFIPLLRGVSEFQLRYFDRRQNRYVDEWRSPDMKPWLVEVTIRREQDDVPFVTVLSVPGANTNPGS